jgi:hypothetical protein
MSTPVVLAISTTFVPGKILVPETSIPGLMIFASALEPKSSNNPLVSPTLLVAVSV